MSSKALFAVPVAIGLMCISRTIATASPYAITTISVPPSNGFFNFVVGEGLNNLGQAVGYYQSAFSPNTGTGFSYKNGVLTSLTIPGAAGVIARGVNDLGEIVGGYHNGSSGPNQGFVYNNGLFSTLNAPGNSSTDLVGVNNSGQIVGESFGSTNGIFTSSSFLDTNGAFTTISVPGSTSTTVTGINNNGVVVGDFSVANVPGGVFSGPTAPGGSFFYQNGVYTIVGAPVAGTDAGLFSLNGLNDLGQAVGIAYQAPGVFPCILYDNGVVTDLNLPGAQATTCSTSGINDAGQIVGSVYQSGNPVAAYIATPIPEPSSLAVFGLTLAGFMMVKRRCR